MKDMESMEGYKGRRQPWGVNGCSYCCPCIRPECNIKHPGNAYDGQNRGPQGQTNIHAVFRDRGDTCVGGINSRVLEPSNAGITLTYLTPGGGEGRVTDQTIDTPG